MDFVDFTFIRMADEQARTELLDTDSLAQIVSAAYDIDALPVEGPYQPIFDEFRLGFAASASTTLEGAWNPVGAALPTEARFQLSGLPVAAATRVDALWRGSVVARTAAGTGRIDAVDTAWPDPAGLDREIEADLGSLPDDPDELERERRARLLTRIRAAFGDPGSFPDAVLDRWLGHDGATTVGELMRQFEAPRAAGAVRVTLVADAPATPVPLRLPIVTALLIRDAGFPVAELVSESLALRERLGPLGLERPRDPRLPLLHPILVTWVVPVTVFEDDGWPGGEAATTAAARRTARRVAAGRWLAREGIGLIAIEPPP